MYAKEIHQEERKWQKMYSNGSRDIYNYNFDLVDFR